MTPPIATSPRDEAEPVRPETATPEAAGQRVWPRLSPRWAGIFIWGMAITLLTGLFLRSAWRDDTLNLNVKGTALTLGISRGTVFTGYSEIQSQSVKFTHHTTRHRLYLWWKPQILYTHRGVVCMLPLWIPLGIVLSILGYRLMRRRFLLNGLPTPVIPAVKPLAAPRSPAP